MLWCLAASAVPAIQLALTALSQWGQSQAGEASTTKVLRGNLDELYDGLLKGAALSTTTLRT